MSTHVVHITTVQGDDALDREPKLKGSTNECKVDVFSIAAEDETLQTVDLLTRWKRGIPLFRSHDSRNAARLGRLHVHTLFLHFLDNGDGVANKLEKKYHVKNDRQHVASVKAINLTFAFAVLGFYALMYFTTKPFPPWYMDAFPFKLAVVVVAMANFTWLRVHKQAPTLRYFALFQFMTSIIVTCGFQVSDDYFYFGDYAKKGGVVSGPFDPLMRSLIVVIIYGVSMAQPRFTFSILAPALYAGTCIITLFCVIPGLKVSDVTSAASIYFSIFVASSMNQFVIDLYKRKIFVLEDVLSKILSMDIERFHAMKSDVILKIVESLAATTDLKAAMESLRNLMDEVSNRTTVKQQRFKGLFSAMIPQRFSAMKDELEFQSWKHGDFLKMFRFSTLLELGVFIVDPFLNDNRSVRSPTLCLDTALGPFLRTFRLIAFPSIAFTFFLLSFVKRFSAILHQYLAICMTLLLGWCTIYIIARISAENIERQSVLSDGTITMFGIMLYYRVISFGCGSKMTLRYLMLGLLFLDCTGFLVVALVEVKSITSIYVLTFFVALTSIAMVVLGVKYSEDTDRRLFALLKLFDLEVCQIHFVEGSEGKSRVSLAEVP
ncbi:hypothetical protein HDU97_002231 [Phlyctochytrium planicorne]|nr:hypothetical protein HDU97_002231 [Phlyctochytrium planicorne]